MLLRQGKRQREQMTFILLGFRDLIIVNRLNYCFNKQHDTFKTRAHVSTFSVTGPLIFLNIYKILSIAALYVLMTVLAS